MASVNGTNGATKEPVITLAELLLPCEDIPKEVVFWNDLGFRMDQIYPADSPQVTALSGHGLHLRLDKTTTTAPGTVRFLCRETPHREPLTSPSGTRVEFVSASTQFPQPPTQHTFATRRLKDNAPWVIGRAGMHYRDLVPSRLGGAIIASHIRIPDAGPVPDKVHYHEVGFQLIFCIHGWVRLVYEDQGPPFILNAGDCVIQPPTIRHRVLESGNNLQVLEIGVPAEHVTSMDYEMELPTPTRRPEREWEGQKFVHSLAKEAVWAPWRIPGFEARETGIGKGTQGVASVRVARPVAGNHGGRVVTSHDSDIHFTFVLSGECTLYSEDGADHKLIEGDAYTLPPGYKSWLTDLSKDLGLIEVSLPADYKTTVHPAES